MGMAPTNPSFGMGQNSLAAQKSLQNSLMGYQGQQAGMGRQFQQQQFNSEMNPGILGYLGAGVSAVSGINDIMGAAQRQNQMKMGMGGSPGSQMYGPPAYLGR
jgi:hypothetical protein